MTTTNLSPVEFSDLEGWNEESHFQSFQAFLKTARHMIKAPYSVKKFDVDSAALLTIAKYALTLDLNSNDAARVFFEQNFTPHKINPEDGSAGFVTGYYEPEVRASRNKTERFNVPLYRRPKNLINVDDSNRPSDMDSYFQFGRKTENGIETYPNRAAINNGFLDHQHLELVYLEHYIDAFFIHIQGSARLLLNDNGNDVMRVGYSAKTGHPFTAIGRILLAWEELTPEEISMQTIKNWLYTHPEEAMDLMERNESYIFFEELIDSDPTEGPIGAAKVPLTPRKSIAVDKHWHTYGSPIWVSLQHPLFGDDSKFQHLMIAHDTGSAIVGEARGDLFMGSGKAAGEIAGHIKQNADFYLLLPKS